MPKWLLSFGKSSEEITNTFIKHISPADRRQALQSRIASVVPRYMRDTKASQPYHTNNTLLKIEHWVTHGLLPDGLLLDDNMLMGVIWQRASDKDAEEGKPIPNVPVDLQGESFARGVQLWQGMKDKETHVPSTQRHAPYRVATVASPKGVHDIKAVALVLEA